MILPTHCILILCFSGLNMAASADLLKMKLLHFGLCMMKTRIDG